MTSDDGQNFNHPVIIEESETHAIIRLNRPQERNPLSAATLSDLDDAFSELTSRIKIKSIIFVGTGDVFASGADIRELQTLTPVTAIKFAERGQRLFQKISDATQLTIAAINGYCMGGALDLALACDLRIANHNAVFAHPGARLGIITGWGGTQRLNKLVGTARALEMFTTARRLDADEALQFGLIDAVENDALACALRIARTKYATAQTDDNSAATF